MRFSVVAVLVAAGVVSASLLPRQGTGLPECANTCIAGSLGETECAPTDNACLCGDTAFVEAVTGCVTTSCTGADLQAALAGAQQMCADAGATVTPPGSSTASSTTATSTSSGSTTVTTTGTTTQTTTGTTVRGTSSTTTQTAPATSQSAGNGNGALTNGVSAAAGIAAVVLGAIAL